MSTDFYADREKGNSKKELVSSLLDTYFASEGVYTKFFLPDGNNKPQRAGLDVLVVLNSGKIHSVDFKVDFYTFDTMLFETWSNKEKQKPGWAMDATKLNNWILYVQPKQQQAFIVPRQKVYDLTTANYDAWLDLANRKQDGFSLVQARNKTYVTECIAIPTATVIEHFGKKCHLTWKD